ncbi:MAG: DinB family protein, partial [Flavobacterium sp.]
MTTHEVLNELLLLTTKHLEQLQHLKTLSVEQLNHKPTAEQWNILQCITHLNHYFDFYLPQFKNAMNGKKKEQQLFKTGVVGKYFANMLLYRENQKPIKSPTHTNPINENVSLEA